MANITFNTCPGKFSTNQHLAWFSYLNALENGWIKLETDVPNRNIEAIGFLKEIKEDHLKQR